MPEKSTDLLVPTLPSPLRQVRVVGQSGRRQELLDRISLSRWRRRRLIRQIEGEIGRTLLCYVSRAQAIQQEDVLPLVALLDPVARGSSITLLLNSPGGDPDAAEALAQILRATVAPIDVHGGGELEIVVPDQAKSAATLMALGADRVLMSDASELGPIDPQVVSQDGDILRYFSVLDYLAAYESLTTACQEHPENLAFREALGRFDPTEVQELRRMKDRTRRLGEDILRRRGISETLVVSRLMDRDRFPSHGQRIDCATAEDLGLRHVKYVPRTDALWRRYWSLYTLLRAVAGNDKKVFASRHVFRVEGAGLGV